MEVEMKSASWTLVLCVVLTAATRAGSQGVGQGSDAPQTPSRDAVRLTAYQRGGAGRGLSVRWIGQDGQDYVSANDRHEPDERADVHLALAGLDSNREIAFIDITAPNGHHWQYNPLPGRWHVHMNRRKGATTADLWVGPIDMDSGLVCHMLVRYDDQTSAEAVVRSHKTSWIARPAAVSVKARWIGQDRQDLTGLGPCVGPDGLKDARIHLTGLSPRYPIKSIRVEASGGGRWEFGTNPQLLNNAEFVKDAKDAQQGDLYLQPDRDLAGQRLRLSVLYEGDVAPDGVAAAAGKCDPKLRMPSTPLPKVEELTLTSQWLGQDGSGAARPGEVHVLLGGLPASARIVAIAVTDTVREAWQYRANEQVPALLDGRPGSLDVRFRPDRKSADIYLTPYRDTSHETFSVRVVAADGRTWQGRFPGGPCELTRLAPMPERSRAEARPGDDIQALLERNGTVVLTKGTYRLRHPLVLNRPATLTSSGGATLLFSQVANDRAWTTAIKVRRSNTTLEGFAVRFEGRIRWDWNVSYGPAVIGMTDNTEPGYNELKSGVVFRKLDLEIPPAEDPSKWAEALRLIRLVGASSGAIVGNRLRGGPIEFFHGPWHVIDNEYRGTPPGTYSHGFVTGHWTHDLVIRGNHLSSPPPSGKTWRFLVLTGSSVFDRIESNVVEGVGARDDDTIPWSNEPEIILTEGYSLKYEGRVLASSTDGKVLRIGHPQGGDVHAGDVVAVLNGPGAGQWRRVLHVLDPLTYLLDAALPPGSDAVSICQGFVSEVFEGNRIDLRGGRRSDAFVLPGNHFGTQVIGNHLLGGGLAWRLTAYPTEHPGIWGWSHVTYMAGVVERNVLEDTESGGIVGVEHTVAVKSNKGRSYMSIQLRDNIIRWTEPFVSARIRAGLKEPLAGLTVGYRPSADAYELLVTASGNGLDAPAQYRDAPGLVVHAAAFNAQKVVDRKYKLPAAKGVDSSRREAQSGAPRSRR
jgi:hypothetical protein